MNYALRVVTPVVVLTAACSSGFHPPPARPAVERSATTASEPKGTAEQTHRAHAHHAGHQLPTSATMKPVVRSESRGTSAKLGLGTAGEKPRPALEALGRAPLAFEAHQTDANVFVSRTPAYTLRVGPGYADILPARPTVNGSQVRMRLIDASTDIKADAGDALPGTVNYVLGNDPSQWRTAVATHAKIRYEAVYPGIDLVYYGTQREIEYDFVVAPGASPSRIALGFEGVDALALKDNGDLELAHAGQALVLRAPRAYQTIDGQQVTVASNYRVDEATRRVSLEVSEYDRARELVIDPILSYALGLGGVDDDEGNSVAVDAAGNVYVAGFTGSANFPATGTTAGSFDLFLTKLDPTGTVLLSSVFIGGSGADETRGLAIDTSGNAYITGVTRSPNFPVVSALQATLQGLSDAFVIKVNANGSIAFSTYLGSTDLDEAAGIAIDAARNVYVTGTTRGTDFPAASPRQAANAGQIDSFVTKLSPTGQALLYSTYHGGSLTDTAFAIASDPSGNVTVVGTTNSTNFPVSAAGQATNAGLFDAFVSRFNPSGALIWSTYWGGSDIDSAQAVTIDGLNRSMVAGTTASADFPVAYPAQATSGGGLDAFVAGFQAAAGNVDFSTYLGGAGSDRGRGIACDTHQRLYIIGQTFSANFPSIAPAQPKIGGNRDTFVVMIVMPFYNTLSYATYLGGGNNDDGLAIAADTKGRAYITGATMYAYPDLAGASDAFVMRLSAGAIGDNDNDGMPDDWETQFDGDLQPGDDLDGDGLSNLAEFQANTHPTGFFTQYLAEGATGAFFDTQLSLFNPGTRTAIVLLRFQVEGQAEQPLLLSLPPHTRRALNIETDIPALAEASFATVAESDAQIVVDRTMTWDTNGFGSHAETAASELSRTWHLAEGATHGTFDLYYLLQNPHPTDAATVNITYLLPNGQAPITLPYSVPARGRLTINVDTVATAPNQPQNQRPLRATDVSATIQSSLPILVERAMYQTSGGRLFNAGHESMGITAPSTNWFFAEGATGSYFDMYLLLANPGDTQATVKIDYLFAGGGVLTKENIVVLAKSRTTLGIDHEDPQLSDAAMSMRITSSVPIIAERAMWWPSPNWHEAHNSAGSVVTSPRWALAEGEVGGSRNLVTYVLIANTSASEATVRVSPFYEDGSVVASKTYTVPGNSRFNVDMGSEFEVSEGNKFSVLVEAQGPQELVVERAMYSNSRGVTWAAGTNALGTPLFPDATFIITPGGIFPKKMVIDEGTRVKFINRGAVGRQMSSDPHPSHEICPPINEVGFLAPGQEGLTGNMVLDPGLHACGLHDHDDDQNDAVRAKIIVR